MNCPYCKSPMTSNGCERECFHRFRFVRVNRSGGSVLRLHGRVRRDATRRPESKPREVVPNSPLWNG